MAQPVRSNHDDATLLVVVCLVREWFTDLSNDFISTATAAQPGERVLAETPSTKGDRPVSPDSLDESRNRLHQLSIFGSRVESGLMNFDLARKLTLRKVGRINGPSDFDKLVAHAMLLGLKHDIGMRFCQTEHFDLSVASAFASLMSASWKRFDSTARLLQNVIAR